MFKYTEEIFDPIRISQRQFEMKWKNQDLDGKVYKINVWDSNGMEHYQSMTPSQMRNIQAYMIVFDLTNA